MRAASAGEIMSQASSHFIAVLRGILRASATIGVEQNRPILTPGVANFAAREAMARSQLATNWQPAAVAVAWTQAITGCGSVTTCCITPLHISMMRLK